jgi:hypothetical protein
MLQLLGHDSMEDARFAKESNEIMRPPELLWLTMRAASEAKSVYSSIISTS